MESEKKSGKKSNIYGKKVHQSRTITVEPFVCLFLLASIAHLTTIPQLTLVKFCHLYFNQTVCLNITKKAFEKEQDIIHSTASLWDILLRSSTMGTSLIVTIFIGPITDNIGRRTFLLIQPIIRALQSLFLIMNSYFMSLHPGFLLFATFIAGFGGSLQGGLLPSRAYIADVNKEGGSISKRMIILEGVIYISAGLGGLLGGVLVQHIGYTYTYISTFLVSATNFFYVYCYLPDERKNAGVENENHENHENTDDINSQQKLPQCNKFSKFTSQIVDCIRNIKSMAKLVLKNQNTKFTIIALMCIDICYGAATRGYDAIYPFYTKHYPFNFSSQKVGIFIFLDHFIKGSGLMIISNIVLRYMKVPDYLLLLIGFTMQIALYVTIGSAHSTVVLFCALLSGCGAALPGGVLSSIITKKVPDDLHGSAVGLLATTTMFADLFAGILAESVYSASVSWYAGLVYYVLALGPFVGIIIVIGIHKNIKDKEEIPQEETLLLRRETSCTDQHN